MRRVSLAAGVGLVLAACGPVEPRDDLQKTEAALGTLVINEHSAGSSGWVELFNSGTSPVDVSGWSVDDIAGGGTAPKVLPAGSVVPAGGFFVATYSGFNAASADTVNLLDAAGATVDSHSNGYAGSSVTGLCFGRQPDGGAWSASPVACTRGASNGGGTTPPATTVLINEFQAGSSGWIELYNPGPAAADLTGWAVDDLESGGSSPKSVGSGVSVPAKGYVVVSYSGINTASADSVRLVDATGATVDSHANFYAGLSIAGLCFGRQLDGGAWASAGISCTKGTGNSGGTPPTSAKVLINEFVPGSAGWVELFNAGETTVDLTGWKIDDVASGGASPKAIPAGTRLAVGQVVLVNYGGINTASADAVRLLDPAGVEADAHASYYGADPCFAATRCYGRIPDGGPWAHSHIPCTGAAKNPESAPAVCVPGQACDDGNACTSSDVCSSACVCVAGPVLTCDDQDPCTTDSCWSGTGCTHTPAPDGTACAGGKVCQGGVCGGTGPAPCVATGGTYKTVAFTKDEECRAVAFLNQARYSQMNPIPTTARDIAYDCSPGAGNCGYRSAAWSTVAQYADAKGGASSLTVGTTSLAALKSVSAGFVADGLWYDTVARTFANRTALNELSVHFESVVAESRVGLCLLVRDRAGAPEYLSACVDPWFCGPEGCPADYLQQYVGKALSVRGRLTNETGSWKVAVKTLRAANPKVQ